MGHGEVETNTAGLGRDEHDGNAVGNGRGHGEAADRLAALVLVHAAAVVNVADTVAIEVIAEQVEELNKLREDENLGGRVLLEVALNKGAGEELALLLMSL